MSYDHQKLSSRMAHAIRFLAADAINRSKSGHPGMPLGMADVATVLFSRYVKINPAAPRWFDRDRFVLSAGHGSMLLYSLLYLLGFEDISLEDIKNFRQLGAKTAGHPEYGHLAGVEMTTGPLGQGIASAVGMAMAERRLNARFGDALCSHYTYVIAGDGCLMEGISEEAIALAGHWKLNKLIVFWDNNNITIDGTVDKASSVDQIKRFEAAGWKTLSVDGHDQEAVAAAIEEAHKSDRPVLVACKTVIGFGARPNREPVPVTVRRSATRNGRQWLPVCNGRMPRLKFPPTFCPPGAKPAGVLCPLMTNGAERRRPPVRNLTMLSTTVCRKLGQSSERVKKRGDSRTDQSSHPQGFADVSGKNCSPCAGNYRRFG